MHSKTTSAIIVTFTALLFVGFGACSKSDKPDPEPGNEKKGIQIRNDATFGAVLTDPNGKTLYFFSNDATGTSNCTGGCATIWPIYYSAEASTDPNLDKETIGEITRPDGNKQSTYKGWPLYYYASDTNADDIKGDGVSHIWFVAKPDYALMLVNNQLIGADGNHYKEDLSIGEGPTNYFTDGAARTLYAFAPDKLNTNTFTKEDFSNDAIWPIYQANTGPLPSIIEKDLVGSITVFGKKQLTYKGWPLYYFGQDTQRGDNKGISFPQPGVWPIVNVNTQTAPDN